MSYTSGTEALEQMGDFLPAFKEWLLSCEPGFAMSRLLILAWHIKRPPAKSQERYALSYQHPNPVTHIQTYKHTYIHT
eukprot:3949586-Amphidinium_carterae.1